MDTLVDALVTDMVRTPITQVQCNGGLISTGDSDPRLGSIDAALRMLVSYGVLDAEAPHRRNNLSKLVGVTGFLNSR